MGEFELIRRYFATAPCARGGASVNLGIGDDCALLALNPGEQLAISTDTLVADLHFPSLCEPYLLGQRALAVCASDLAAMGARPIGFTLALTLPNAEAVWLEAFARGLNHQALACALTLVGGDTTRGPLSMTLSVLGAVPSGLALTRSAAQPGQLLCVGGPLGDAGAALLLLQGQRQAAPAIAEGLLARYWSPEPQLALGQALRGKAGAALDISDGLLADCQHIAQASAVALTIQSALLPSSPALKALLEPSEVLNYQLSAGDDYVLAFTLPAEHLPWLRENWPEAAVIGQVEAGRGVRVLDADGCDITPIHQGYQHFQS